MEEDISLCYLQYNMCLWEEDNSNISKFASVLWPAKDQLNCWKIKGKQAFKISWKKPKEILEYEYIHSRKCIMYI